MKDILDIILNAIGDKKGIDPVVIDLKGISSFTDYFVIAHGDSEKQVEAIYREIEQKLREKIRLKPIGLEGVRDSHWILMDYGDFIVHIFYKDVRQVYDLESLWKDRTVYEKESNI